MPKYDIVARAELCTGCFRCGLACSELLTKSFEPARARIRIGMSGLDAAIAFAEDCLHCGTCADNCCYGALEKVPREKEAAS